MVPLASGGPKFAWLESVKIVFLKEKQKLIFLPHYSSISRERERERERERGPTAKNSFLVLCSPECGFYFDFGQEKYELVSHTSIFLSLCFWLKRNSSHARMGESHLTLIYVSIGHPGERQRFLTGEAKGSWLITFISLCPHFQRLTSNSANELKFSLSLSLSLRIRTWVIQGIFYILKVHHLLHLWPSWFKLLYRAKWRG